MCKCAELPNVFVGNDEKNPFSDTLEELEWAPQRWATLNRCPACNQLWHIDIAKQNDIGVCAKIPTQEAWQQLDTTNLKVQLMVQNHGGLSDATCQWKQCQEKCVKGLAFCPSHAYFEMDIKQ